MRRASSVISPITDASVSSFTEGTWARGITSMCTGACGPMSRKARHVSLSATSFAGISPPAILQKRHDSAIRHLLLPSRDRRRERRERAPHDGERRDGGGLEAQGRVADRDGAEPRALERVQLVLLDAAFGSDGERARAGGVWGGGRPPPFSRGNSSAGATRVAMGSPRRSRTRRGPSGVAVIARS